MQFIAGTIIQLVVFMESIHALITPGKLLLLVAVVVR